MSLLLLYRPRRASSGGGGGGTTVGPAVLGGGDGGEFFDESAYRKAIAAVQSLPVREKSHVEDLIDEAKAQVESRSPVETPTRRRVARTRSKRPVPAAPVVAVAAPPVIEDVVLTKDDLGILDELLTIPPHKASVVRVEQQAAERRALARARLERSIEKERARRYEAASRREQQDLRDALHVLELLAHDDDE